MMLINIGLLVNLEAVMPVDARVGLWRKLSPEKKKRKLSTEELMLLNCGVGVDSWESLGLQGDPTSPF